VEELVALIRSDGRWVPPPAGTLAEGAAAPMNSRITVASSNG